MGPGRLGGVGPAAAAIVTALVVAVVVVAMVGISGGLNRPLVAPAPGAATTHVAAARVAARQS